MKYLVVFTLLSLVSNGIHAKSQRPIPRFVSIRASEANLRVGPGKEYPPEWTFIKSNIPIEITAEFDNWRRVRDVDGTEGWFHKSMLKSTRFGVINKSEVVLRSSDRVESPGRVRLAQGVIVHIKKCPKNNPWCYVNVDAYEGWLQRDDMWGVYESEKV